MLFQQLYNWIKYKTLPPSVLFKNRLFVERDSKNRKIFNNFGLIFRNTRWSGYETYNISLNSRTPLYRFFFLFVFVIIFFFVTTNFKYFYIYHWAFNLVSFLWWSCVDIFDYYLVFSVWFAITAISSLINLIYFYFFFNKLKISLLRDQRLSSKILNHERRKITTFGKHDLGLLLYSWLINGAREKKLAAFDQLFAGFFNLKQWGSSCIFFVKLYKLTYLLNLSTSRNTTLFSLSNINRMEKKTPSFGIFNFKFLPIFFFYNLCKRAESANDRSGDFFFIKNRFEWNPFSFDLELQKFNFLFKYKNGQFFFKNINFGEFSYYLNNNQEFLTLSNNLRNQLNAAKWNRWLYRYSLLHRKVFKNSHKITSIKKLINFSSSTKSLYRRNLWISEHFKNFENNDRFFNALSGIFFDKFSPRHTDSRFTVFNIFNLNKTSGSFNKLSSYENSFFWYLKRNYILNTLSSNNVKGAFNLKTSIGGVSADVTARLKYFVLLSVGADSLFLNTQRFQIFSLFSENLLLFKNFKNRTLGEGFLIKDLSLILNDKSFLTGDCLERIFWMSAQSSNLKHQSGFFDYFGSELPKPGTMFGEFYTDPIGCDLMACWALFTILHYDSPFISDLKYLTFF